MKAAERNKKGKIIGKDLEDLTTGIFEHLKSGKRPNHYLSIVLTQYYGLGVINVSYKHAKGLMKRAREIDSELGYHNQTEILN